MVHMGFLLSWAVTEGLRSALEKLDISAVPTLHFFVGGKKVSEIVGADVQRLKTTMESLYK
ncbi:putative Thioredoxin-like superfamily [Helianthus annuus]|nr:putative Thioredoxin-like superfamily [Helianthus annuus]